MTYPRRSLAFVYRGLSNLIVPRFTTIEQSADNSPHTRTSFGNTIKGAVLVALFSFDVEAVIVFNTVSALPITGITLMGYNI